MTDLQKICHFTHLHSKVNDVNGTNDEEGLTFFYLSLSSRMDKNETRQDMRTLGQDKNNLMKYIFKIVDVFVPQHKCRSDRSSHQESLSLQAMSHGFSQLL